MGVETRWEQVMWRACRGMWVAVAGPCEFDAVVEGVVRRDVAECAVEGVGRLGGETLRLEDEARR